MRWKTLLPSANATEGHWHYETLSWLKYENRRNKDLEPMHDYDIVYGPIADDKVGLQISRYQLQYIPMEELIKQLSFIRPTFQYFFGTERAIRLLHKIDKQ